MKIVITTETCRAARRNQWRSARAAVSASNAEARAAGRPNDQILKPGWPARKVAYRPYHSRTSPWLLGTGGRLKVYKAPYGDASVNKRPVGTSPWHGRFHSANSGRVT